jgi:hypothetical protein
MEKPEDLVRDLVTQVSRVAFALETVAIRAYSASYGPPCKGCGCTLYSSSLPWSTCPVCKTENAR